MGCPQEYDPVANFPQDGSLFLLIAGGRDEVVPLKNSQELLDLAKARGARTEARSDFAHSFMDSDIDIHRARLELIKSFLMGSGRSEEQ
jgi:predicted esterase